MSNLLEHLHCKIAFLSSIHTWWQVDWLDLDIKVLAVAEYCMNLIWSEPSSLGLRHYVGNIQICPHGKGKKKYSESKTDLFWLTKMLKAKPITTCIRQMQLCTKTTSITTIHILNHEAPMENDYK